MQLSKVKTMLKHMTRRNLLRGIGTVVSTALLALGPVTSSAQAEDIALTELARTGGLADIPVGSDEAAVTVIEYASMSCGHCKRFHESVYPKFKEKYVDTGQVRYVFREFPLDNRAAAASLLTRCVAEDKKHAMIDVLFAQQNDWAYFRGDPTPKLFEIAKQAGFTEKAFKTCLADKDQFAKLIAGRERAASVFGVKSTPTFFVNGKKLQGNVSLETLSEVIDPILPKS
ncbi:MAG: DsbA family protein [Pseudomonadota bacterium]